MVLIFITVWKNIAWNITESTFHHKIKHHYYHPGLWGQLVCFNTANRLYNKKRIYIWKKYYQHLWLILCYCLLCVIHTDMTSLVLHPSKYTLGLATWSYHHRWLYIYFNHRGDCFIVFTDWKKTHDKRYAMASHHWKQSLWLFSHLVCHVQVPSSLITKPYWLFKRCETARWFDSSYRCFITL